MSWAAVIKNHVRCKGKGFFRVLLPVLIVSVSLAVPKEARETGTALLEDGQSPVPHSVTFIFSSLFISLCLLLLPPSLLLLSVTWFLSAFDNPLLLCLPCLSSLCLFLLYSLLLPCSSGTPGSSRPSSPFTWRMSPGWAVVPLAGSLVLGKSRAFGKINFSLSQELTGDSLQTSFFCLQTPSTVPQGQSHKVLEAEHFSRSIMRYPGAALESL